LNIEGGVYVKETNKFAKIPAKELRQAEKNDQISHFICRLAYCRNDDLRKWFVAQETRLFYHRLAATQPENILAVLRDKCGMNYQQLSEGDAVWVKFREQITFNVDAKSKEAAQFIKVPFKDALSLVS